MRRLILWMRAHPSAGDSMLMLLVLLAEITRGTLGDAVARSPAPFWDVFAGVLLVLPLVLRRTLPVPIAYLMLLGLLVQLVTQQEMVTRPAAFVVLIMLYTLVAYVGRSAAACYACGIAVTWLVPLVLLDELHGGMPLVLFAIQLGLELGFCWVLGEYVGARRAYQEATESRLRSLEFEQDQQARIAVAEERNRIARELHDVLAHSVSVMVTHADGATYAVRRKPELAEQALTTIGNTGRDALSELRSLLHVLRHPEERDDTGDRSPQPGANGVRDLVERVRALGLPVTLRIDGELDRVPTGPGLAVYRIVQESLTNVLKHAGWNATATVSLEEVGSSMRIEVSDSGARGVLAPQSSGGNGVIGMRERATVYGGSLEAGPNADGGWSVRADLPLEGERAAAGTP
ncbi:sensor histidine kinase [Actinopolyspora halophila]|uniref:sensor histidine kinase n=1 Tax=Actinopolyspora halophila TaxID=1850 RepID=UPI001FE23329|nr:histidine kinase [Actinopolyspora halophila]